MESVEGVKKRSKGKEVVLGGGYGFEIKLRCGEVTIGRRDPFSLLSKEVGASKSVIGRWVKAYIRSRESLGYGTCCFPRGVDRSFLVQCARKIVEIKKRAPLFGVKADFPSFKACILSERESRDGAADLRAESLIVPSKKKHQPKYHPSSFF